MKFAIIGLGGRGATYAHFIKYYGSETVAVCDPDINKMEKAREYGVSEDAFFTSENEFFARGRLADAIVIASLDTMHYRQTVRALDAGYDVLLEKPIAMTLEECEDIRERAERLGRRVIVCHVLRYAPFYVKTKEILNTGLLGDIVNMEMTEDIAYYHYAHSYCRGNWRNTEISSPLILAKNSHDTDMLSWLIGKKCLAVSSFGSLLHFKEENAPEGSASHCYLCKYRDDCKYSCFRIYNNEEYERVAALAKHGRLGATEEEINASLSDPDNILARCVYRCDNNVADNQIVNMLFEDGITAQLKSIAFTEKMGRRFMIYGTEGVLYFDKAARLVIVEKLGGEVLKFPIPELKGAFANHGGGDVAIVEQFIKYIECGEMSESITDIATSIMGHKIAFLAEESRLSGGKLLYL